MASPGADPPDSSSSWLPTRFYLAFVTRQVDLAFALDNRQHNRLNDSGVFNCWIL